MYLIPAPAPVSCGWWCHKDRDPPSSEPGTDYATAYGTPLVAAGTGTVTGANGSPAGAPGRWVSIALDDGRTVRYLHLAEVWVVVGQRIAAGAVFGLSGASGYGNDWYYGPHVHVTLWPGAIWAAPTIDFELYVAAPPAPPTALGDEEMRVILYKDTGTVYTFGPQQVKCETDIKAAEAVRSITGSQVNTATGFYECGPPEISALCESFGVPWSAVERANTGRAYLIDGTPGNGSTVMGRFWSAQFDLHQSDPTPEETNPLVTPAWVAGFFLGLIGLVEVIRLVIDALV